MDFPVKQSNKINQNFIQKKINHLHFINAGIRKISIPLMVLESLAPAGKSHARQKRVDFPAQK